jgi:uncharacterized protein YjbI with pentapeptide repeats
VQFYQIENLQQKIEQIKGVSQNRIDYTRLLELINLSNNKLLQMPNLKLSFMHLSYLDLSYANMRGCDFSHCNGVEMKFN